MVGADSASSAQDTIRTSSAVRVAERAFAAAESNAAVTRVLQSTPNMAVALHQSKLTVTVFNSV